MQIGQFVLFTTTFRGVSLMLGWLLYSPLMNGSWLTVQEFGYPTRKKRGEQSPLTITTFFGMSCSCLCLATIPTNHRSLDSRCQVLNHANPITTTSLCFFDPLNTLNFWQVATSLTLQHLHSCHQKQVIPPTPSKKRLTLDPSHNTGKPVGHKNIIIVMHFFPL